MDINLNSALCTPKAAAGKIYIQQSCKSKSNAIKYFKKAISLPRFFKTNLLWVLRSWQTHQTMSESILFFTTLHFDRLPNHNSFIGHHKPMFLRRQVDGVPAFLPILPTISI